MNRMRSRSIGRMYERFAFQSVTPSFGLSVDPSWTNQTKLRSSGESPSGGGNPLVAEPDGASNVEDVSVLVSRMV